MSLEKRLWGIRGSPSSLAALDGEMYFPPAEIYQCYVDFEIPEADIVEDLMDWAEYFPQTIRNAKSDKSKEEYLGELDKLYEVSLSPIIGEVIRELHSEGYYDAFNIDDKNVRNYLDLTAALRVVEPLDAPKRTEEVQRLGEIMEELFPPKKNQDDFNYDEFQSSLSKFNRKSNLEFAFIAGLTGTVLATVGYFLSIQ